MPTYTFGTPTPAKLYAELRSGRMHITATETDTTTVSISGKGADDVEVDQDGDQINIIEPQRFGISFGFGEGLLVEATVPLDSQLRSKTGSTDVTARGRLAAAWLQGGSGDVDLEEVSGPLEVTTGSGDTEIRALGGPGRIKSGSGDVVIGDAGETLTISAGSGDIRVKHARGAVSAKTGSGDVLVDATEADVSLATGSGTLEIGRASRGRIESKGASGDFKVGIPAGTPVWTDISTVTGAIRSSLQSAGEPAPGQDHVELRARTVSGDIVLQQV